MRRPRPSGIGIAATFVVLLLPLAAAGGSQAHNLGTPSAIAAAGWVMGVAQGPDSIAWLEQTASGCRLRVRPIVGTAGRTIRYAPRCLPEHRDLALAGGRAAWGGYEEVRCADTHAAVYATAGARARVVHEIPGDCLGYATAFQGLVTDGVSFYYSLLVTRPEDPASTCGDGGRCRWSLGGGRIVRIAGSKPQTVAGLPPAALLAAADGRIALVEPARSASSSGRGVNAFDWPRAARNGMVEIRRTKTKNLLASFRPRGTIRAVALSGTRAAVLVEGNGARRIEWYDAETGERLGSAPVPRSATNQISTDGSFVAFAVAKTVRVLDLETATATARIVKRTASEPVGLSVAAGRLAWGENTSGGSRIVSAAARPA